MESILLASEEKLFVVIVYLQPSIPRLDGCCPAQVNQQEVT